MHRLFVFISIIILLLTPAGPSAFSVHPAWCRCPAEPILRRSSDPSYHDILYQLQRYWASLSLYPGTPNGRFDQTMEKAVIAFQKKHRLPLSGALDEPTWEKIGAVPAETEAGSSQTRPTGSIDVLVDLDSLTLTILCDRVPFKSYPVAIGTLETPSPAGSWEIVHKGYWAKGKTHWLGLSVPFGSYGIHGTNQPWTIGTRASNGCIRMYNHHLEEVYRWLKPGTRVFIAGDPFRDHRHLKRGMAGSDVYYLQIRLKQLGSYRRKPTGHFDYWTEIALKEAQRKLGLPETGELSPKEYYRFKLYLTD